MLTVDTQRDVLSPAHSRLRFPPQWFWKLPTAKIRGINTAFAEFESYIFDMIDERRAMEAQGVVRNDLFSGLIRASDNEQGNAKLTPQELLADIHVFLLAGFETTAHSLMATLMLLALYPEHQARIVQEVREALGEDGEDHGFEKYSKLVSRLRHSSRPQEADTPIWAP
jgi:cytochrome P450